MPKDKLTILTKKDLPEISSREKIEVPHLEYSMGEKFGGFTITPDDMTRGDKSLADLVDTGVDDIINDRINTQTAEILAEWTFGTAGAFAMKTDVNNGLWISPTGILAKKAGNSTFTITASGDATFTGTIAAGAVISADISADNITAGTLSVDRISANSITSSKIGSDLTDANISSINFNNITASNISADNITAGTLTGRTVRTSSGTTRVEMTSSDNTLKVYKSGIIRTSLGEEYIKFKDSSDNGSGAIYGSGNKVVTIATGNIDYMFRFDNEAFHPGWSGMSIGRSTSRWPNIYGTDISISGDATVDDLIVDSYVKSDLIPGTNNLYVLGDSSRRWGGIYTEYLRSYGDIRADKDLLIYGDAAFGGNLIFSSIPTSDPGIAGVVYRDGTDLRISTG